MCGRFASNTPPYQLQQWYDALVMPDVAPRYNIAPGTMIVAVREMPQGREGSLMRWGFIPSWAKDPGSMPMLNNARGETVAEKPMFRQAFRRRRCLIPASGFYEWKAVPGQKLKQPFYISFRDATPMSFAGLWESSHAADGTMIDTCTIITTEANGVLAPIHNRMPVIIDRPDWSTWLAAKPVDEAELMRLVKPFDPERMQAWGVAHAVNKVVNDDPSLLEPIA
ncbi:SOS response-associated peptidase [Herbaspirillum sp. HC18]|nr:SOS response-associated peptidase [Herbaspirillum sp. HC18]